MTAYFSKDIPERIIDTWEELKSYIDENEFITTKREIYPIDVNYISSPTDLNWKVFRGVSDAKYDLSSTLERYIRDYYKKTEISSEAFYRISKCYLEECKKRMKGKIPEQYILYDKFYENEIFFYGQHYDLATPFLDWSKSFFVALYFAFEVSKTKSDYRAVYCLKTNSIGNSSKANVIIYEPKLDLGGRVTAQKGVFTRMLSKELEEINQYAEKPPMNDTKIEPPLTKLLISSDVRAEIMEFLLSINIDHTTIYPDIKGTIKNCILGLDNILELHSVNACCCEHLKYS